ncbi:MAG: heme exporter protein CcmB [Chloroflexi bacterium]|nr:heme exporter protein CcmB [Chloroflexota bacterium]
MLGKVGAIVWKDVLAELRTKDIVLSVGVFAVLVIIVFNFAFQPGAQGIGAVAPGALWVAVVFAGVLGMNRAFVLEKERGTLPGLLLCPVPREAIFAGKMAASLLFMLLVEAAVVPLFGVFLGLPLFPPALVPIVLLATLGFAAAGTLFSAVAASSRSRELMLPILLLPVLVPVILSAVGASAAVFAGEPFGEYRTWVQVLIGFDVVYLVLSAWVFEYVVQE